MSQNFPSPYPNNHIRNQTIEVENGKRIHIKFTNFSVENSNSCQFDYVLVEDGDGTILMEKTCGSNLPPDVISRTNTVKVIFDTDVSSVRTGWKLEYSYLLLDCIVLDTATRSWIPGLKPLKKLRTHSSAVALTDGVFILGGTGSPYTSEFLPSTSLTARILPSATLNRAETRSHLWEEGPALPISMDYGCAVAISDKAFMIINNGDIREFEISSGNPTSYSNWKASSAWPKLQMSRRGHPGCAVIGTTLVIAGGFKSLTSSSATTHASSSSSTQAATDLQWCSLSCPVRQNPECCYHPDCLTAKPQICAWLNYLRYGGYRGSAGIRSGSSSGNTYVKSTEVLNLQTRKIWFGGDLQGPTGFLQMITLGQGDFIYAFANPGIVDKKDLVHWDFVESEWNQGFADAVSGEPLTWPGRFGAVIVSKNIACPKV